MFNSDSGIFYKNETYFVFGTPKVLLSDKWCGVSAHPCYYDSEINKPSSFYLERDGFVIMSGNITGRIATALEFGENYYRYDDWSKVLDEINHRADCDSDEVMQYRSELKSSQLRQLGGVYRFDSGVALKDTMVFGVRANIPPMIAGDVYGVYAVGNGTVSAQALDTATGRFMDNKVTIKVDDWKLLQQKGIIGVMSKVTNFIEEDGLVSCVQASTKLPAELQNLDIDKVHYEAIVQAVANSRNFTVFLNSKLALNSALIDAVNNYDANVPALVGCSGNNSVADKIALLLNEHCNISRFIEGAVSSDYLELQLSDFEYEWESYANANSIVMADRVFAKSLYSYGIEAKKDIKNQFILHEAEKYGLESCVKELIAAGLDSDNRKMIQMSAITDKTELLRYFAIPNFEINGKEWSDIIRDWVNTGLYFAYHTTFGFMICNRNNWMCRDYNSVAILDSAYMPAWRVVELNEKHITYGNPGFID